MMNKAARRVSCDTKSPFITYLVAAAFAASLANESTLESSSNARREATNISVPGGNFLRRNSGALPGTTSVVALSCCAIAAATVFPSSIFEEKKVARVVVDCLSNLANEEGSDKSFATSNARKTTALLRRRSSSLVKEGPRSLTASTSLT